MIFFVFFSKNFFPVVINVLLHAPSYYLCIIYDRLNVFSKFKGAVRGDVRGDIQPPTLGIFSPPDITDKY